MPDTVMRQHLSFQAQDAMGFGKSSSWTVTLWISADGKLLHASILLRGASVLDSTAEAVLNAGYGISATENGKFCFGWWTKSYNSHIMTLFVNTKPSFSIFLNILARSCSSSLVSVVWPPCFTSGSSRPSRARARLSVKAVKPMSKRGFGFNLCLRFLIA